MNLKIKIEEIDGFSDDQKAKINKACDLIAIAVNTQEFIDKMMSFGFTLTTVTGKWWWKQTTTQDIKGFYFTDDETVYTNQQVMEMIDAAIELHHDPEDHTIILDLKCAYSRFNTSATAYGLPTDNDIDIYSWWIDQSGISDLSNTIFHEWLHKLGFEHEFNNSPYREYSVPYQGGDILQEVIDEKIASGEYKV